MPEQPGSFDAGLSVEALDPVIQHACDRLQKVVADVERIRGTIEPHLDELRTRLREQLLGGAKETEATITQRIAKMTDWLEKYARTALSMTKVLDEAARLRSLIAGGPDSRPDLTSLSDAELAKLVLRARKTAESTVKTDV